MQADMIRLQFKSNKFVVARTVRKLEKTIKNRIRVVVADYGEKIYQRTYDLAPKKTYFMVDHLHLDFTQDGFNFTVGWRASDFEAEGFDFYPLFQELGTITAAAQPSLGPASRMYTAHFRKAVATAMKKAARRRS